MDYFFCRADWNCWYNWLWNPGTAAWIQAVIAIGAIWFANKRANDAFHAAMAVEEERDARARNRYYERQHLDQKKTLVRADAALANLIEAAGAVLELREQNKGSFFLPHVSSAIRELRQESEFLKSLIMSDLPRAPLIFYLNQGASIVSTFADAFELRYVQNGLDDNFVGVIESVIGDMRLRKENLRDFYARFDTDPQAAFSLPERTPADIPTDIS